MAPSDETDIPFRTVIDAAGDPMFLVERGGDTFRYVYVNDAFEQAVGGSRDEIVGATPTEVHGASVGAEILASYEHCFEHREDTSYEVTLEEGPLTRHWEVTLSAVVEDEAVSALVGIAQEVTQRVEHERSVTEQRDRLQVLNKVIRHDIRNEMMVARGYGDALDGHVDEEGREYLDIVLEAVENTIDLTSRMRDLTDAMLREELEPKPVNLNRTIEANVDRARERYDDAIVTVEGSTATITVLADELLDTVLHNLLQNAIVHNDKSIPRITVSVEEHEETVSLILSDNGPGIPADRNGELFGEGAKGLESPGTGLGLYLVRSIVTNYDGSVTVENNEDEGCRFIVELPLAE